MACFKKSKPTNQRNPKQKPKKQTNLTKPNQQQQNKKPPKKHQKKPRKKKPQNLSNFFYKYTLAKLST